MKFTTTTRIIVSLSTAFLLGFPTLAGAAEPSDGWARADAQSLGFETGDSPNIWCFVDGGTLGLDPLEACGQ
ncbi:MAG: hypothetical protein ACRBK7_02555 [Acidimicrobiales bacterium]